MKTFMKKSLNSDSHQSTNINKPDNHSMNTKNKIMTYDIAKTRSWLGTGTQL